MKMKLFGTVIATILLASIALVPSTSAVSPTIFYVGSPTEDTWSVNTVLVEFDRWDEDGNNVIETDEGWIVKGTKGVDIIEGSDRHDLIKGGKGNDVIYGGDGDDEIRGGWGADEIYGGEGNDLILGGQNDPSDANLVEELNGEGGDDIIHGGQGKDAINGGVGTDEGYGGRGFDTITACELPAPDGDLGKDQ